MDTTLFSLAFAGYTVSTILYLVYVISRQDVAGRLASVSLYIALAFHVTSLVWRTVQGNVLYGGGTFYLPWTNLYESLGLFSLVVSIVFVAVQLRHFMPILGIFVMPLAWGTAFAAFLADKAIPRMPAILKSWWMMVHIPVMFLSYAAFANAFGIGIAYLIQERYLKSKKPAGMAYRLPSLGELDRLVYTIIGLAFPVLSLGLIGGILWAHSAWGRWWGWDPKETWSLATWLAYLVYFHMRFVQGWRGRKTVYLSLAGFCMAIFTYIGASYLSKLHGFLN